MAYGRAHGLYDEQMREDFAQDYCLAVWLGQSKSLRMQLVNFYRKTFGRTDKFASEGAKARSFALRTMKSYKE